MIVRNNKDEKRLYKRQNVKEKINREIKYLKENFGTKIILVQTPLYEISSTDLRDRIKKGIYPASDIFLFIVESIGLEPITSTLPVSRSSQMS